MSDAFKAEKYSECISSFINDTPGNYLLSLNNAIMLVISMEKVRNMPEQRVHEIIKSLTKWKNGKLYYTVAQELLSGEMRSLKIIITDRSLSPNNTDLNKCVAILKLHEKLLAMQALKVIMTDIPETRIIAWLSIPKEKRMHINEIMDIRYPVNSPNRMQLLHAMLNLYTHTDKENILRYDGCIDLLLWYGKGSTILSFRTADELLLAGKKDGAIRIAKSLVSETDNDAEKHRQLAAFLLRTNEYSIAENAYLQGMKVVEEPYTRELRLDYLEFLITSVRLQPKGYTPHPLPALQADKNALLASDALLIGERYVEASNKYLQVLQDSKSPEGRRLAAWSGLLDSDPTTALQHYPALLNSIEKHDAINRGDELRWLGWQLMRAINREIPPKPGTFATPSRRQFRPLHSVKGWKESLVSMIDRMLTIDHVALLQPDKKAEHGTFRYTAALVYGVAGKMQEAEAVITKPITYTLLPPPGGWPTFGGPKTPDTDKPRPFSSPERGEAERVMTEVMTALARYQTQQGLTHNVADGQGNPPMNVTLITDMATQIVTSEDQATIKSHMRRMGEQVTLAVSTIDLPQQQKDHLPTTTLTDEQKAAQFAPIGKAIQKVFADQEAVREAPQLLFFGLKHSMLVAHSPKLLDELFTFTIDGFTRYIAVTGNAEQGASLAHSFAAALDARTGGDLKPYAQRLREQFPRLEEKK